MSTDCQRCPELETQLAILRADVSHVVSRIGEELEHATMSRRQLLEDVRDRLAFAIEDGAR